MKGSRNSKSFLLIIIFSSICYLLFGYFLKRESFTELIVLYGILFFFFCMLVKRKNGEFETKSFFYVGLIFRLFLLFSIPNLSQDFYRFIWDGRMMLQGLNPYHYRPDDLINNSNFYMPEARQLYDGMRSLSSGHFTNYPPVNQFLFLIAAFLAGKCIWGSIIVFKIMIILADIGIYYFGKKILRRLQMPAINIHLYFLNPFIIIELTGNLHFEGVMILFLLVALYQFQKTNIKRAALYFAISIAVKLVPILLLPLFIRNLKFRSLALFYLLIAVFSFLLIAPFISVNAIKNYTHTTSLWFINFEFNASFYYLVRAIGYYVNGYNIIHTVGRYSPFVIMGMMLLFSTLKSNITSSGLIKNMVFALCIYLFLSTTVHPWYIITPLALSIFTHFRFVIIWSGVIMLSYYAHSNPLFIESPFILLIEYGVVFFFMLEELFKKNSEAMFKKWIA